MVEKKKKHWKTSRQEISSPESETVRKGSKSGAPEEIGRYHMYALINTIKVNMYTQREATLLFCLPFQQKSILKGTNFPDATYMFQGNWPSGSGEKDFLKFLPYMGMAAIFVM